MRTENTGKKCFICGKESGFTKGNKCAHCGAGDNESAIAHLLVKYSGGEQAGIPESADQLKYKRILAVDASKRLQDALGNCDLFTSVSREELKSITGARDGLGFERILVFSEADNKTAALLNKLLAADGIVIAGQAAGSEKSFGNANVWQINDKRYAVYHKKADTKIHFSGERFIPGIEDQKLESEHLQRYLSTRNLVKGLNVLDLACGEGYGSALLAETAESVIGMDIDQETVDHANEKYRKINLSFRQGDAANIPLKDHSIDAVVSFETIEHIDEMLQNQFLQEINRVLKQDGLLIMSTPNKAVYSDRYHYFNEYHIHEFYHDEFQQFLKQYFPYVHIYQQSFQVVSLLSSCNSQTKEATWYGESVDETEAKYYIAVASKKEINLPGMASLFVQKSGENEANIQRIITLQNEETLRNLHIQELDSELETQGKRIRTLQKEHAERDTHIRELDSELEIKGKQIQTLQEEHAERDAHIRELDSELKIKGKQIQTLQEEHAERDAHIRELDSELKIKGKQIQTLQEEHAERDAHIRELDSELETRGKRIQTLQEEQAERDAHIRELDSELEIKGKQIQTLQEEHAERDAHIRELDSELETRGKRIQTLQEEQAERDAHIRELDSELETRGKRIQVLQEEHAERGAHIQQLDHELTEKGKLIRKLQNEEEKRNEHIQKQDEEIRTLTESYNTISAERDHIEEQLNTVSAERDHMEEQLNTVSAERDHMEEQLNTVSAERDHMEEQRNTLVKERDELKEYHRELTKECEEQKQTIVNKEAHIQLLLESDRELQKIHHSRSWKLLTKWWRFRDFLIPPNSKRRLLLKLVKKFLCHPIWCLQRVDMDHIKKFAAGIKSGSIASTSARLDNYLGGGTANTDKPDQFPLIDYASIEDVPHLHVPTSSHPAVSIVIPVYNQFAYTYACLKSIAKNSGNTAYEVIIADDCSTDLTVHLKKAVSGVKVVRNKKNLRFLLNCNNAAKEAKGRYILFLNNDTQVMENWLQPLITLIESKDDIGMVGSKLIYPDGRLQEAGGIVWKDASAWNYGHLDDPTKPEYNYVKEADYISGAAIMIRADLWKQLGGFDERFAPAYFEDTDLAFMTRKAGFKVMFQPLSVVVHFEGISNGTDTNSGQKAYQIENQKKFYEKWKDVLEREHDPNAQNVFKAKDRSQRKKHILVVDHYVPHYDKDAGGRCTYMYLKLFVKMGFKVTFIGDNFFRHEPYTTELNQMGIEVLYGNYYYANWQNWLKENGKAFDYIYLQRPHISIKYIDLVKQYSDAKIIYFAHDLHHIREKREYEITGDPKLLQSAEEWKKTEYKLFGDADVGHVVGSYEQGIMQKAFPDKPIRNIPLYLYEKLPENIGKDFSKRKDLLYVGGFNHHPNVDAVVWFAKEVFPKVLKKYPNMIWHLVGGHLTKEVEDLASDHIIIHGFISDEELEKMYRTCRMAVVPLRYGAGVKGKVIEANYYQIPLVTTPIGAEGISLEENSMIVEENADRMAEIICSLYDNQKKLKELSDNCEKLIRNHYMLDEAERIIRLDFQP